MVNDLIDMLEEEYPQAGSDAWIPENDGQADWLIEVTKADIERLNHLSDQIKEKIETYKNRLKMVEKEKEFIEGNAKHKLAIYMEHHIDPKLLKKTKTQVKYQLPTGEIVKKFPKPKIKRDNNKLLDWVKEKEELKDYIKVKESVAWGELKKQTEQIGDKVVMKETGEIVEGVELEDREPTIEIK